MLTLSSCIQPKTTLEFEAMDTFMSLELISDNVVARQLKNKIERLDSLFSTTDKNSEISRLNRGESFPQSEETVELIQKSQELSEKLSGALDLSVYPLVKEWGFIDSNYKIPSDSRIKSLLKKVDYRKIKVNSSVSLPKGFELTLGAVAKGYAADKSREFLEQKKVKSALLNLGGTVLAYGKKPDNTDWKIGIADPDNPAGYIGFVSVSGKVVATSGGYERYFEQNGKTYIHIIDPKTGRPVDNEISSVSIVSDDGTAADALSTALFVKGLKGAVEYRESNPGFEFVILTKDKKCCLSKGIAKSFTLSENADYEIVKY